MSRFMQGVNLEEVPELQPVPDGTLIVEVESWEEKKSQKQQSDGDHRLHHHCARRGGEKGGQVLPETCDDEQHPLPLEASL